MDLAQAHIESIYYLISSNQNFSYETFNVLKSQNLISLNFVYKRLDTLNNCDPRIRKFISFVKDRPYNDKRYAVTTKKLRKLGWKPKYNLIKDLPKNTFLEIL